LFSPVGVQRIDAPSAKPVRAILEPSIDHEL
jgi:hypothetical protein